MWRPLGEGHYPIEDAGSDSSRWLTPHKSDCARHNEPAKRKRACDCGAVRRGAKSKLWPTTIIRAQLSGIANGPEMAARIVRELRKHGYRLKREDQK